MVCRCDGGLVARPTLASALAPLSPVIFCLCAALARLTRRPGLCRALAPLSCRPGLCPALAPVSRRPGLCLTLAQLTRRPGLCPALAPLSPIITALTYDARVRDRLAGRVGHPDGELRGDVGRDLEVAQEELVQVRPAVRDRVDPGNEVVRELRRTQPVP